jgi:hypothetical protein
MYSTDRAKALEYTISCLQDSSIYQQCQKTLVVDGKIDYVPVDWQVVQVPRINSKFCWGRMWDAGVCSARYDKIVYLDSDRLLPPAFLESIHKKLTPDLFIYTSKHFAMLNECPLATCKKLLNARNFEDMLLKPEFFGKYKYEVRFGEPYHGPSKNVMSGSVGFTKKTYNRLGGVDHWYCGHGAYADSDFHMQAAIGECKFLDLNMPELHFPHNKLSDSNVKLDKKSLHRLGLDNFIYYCNKWGLPMTLAEGLAVRCGLVRPSVYVDKRLRTIKADAKES